jgi:TATA-box binding protein (TBP) (component of TFIID and TFIIIB)
MNSLKISTITLSTQLPDCKINLINVGKYLDINENIVGIKYQFGNLNIMKGQYSTTIFRKSKYKKVEKINKILFYNQISLIVNLKESKHSDSSNTQKSYINVKLFGNGSLHLTGCKTINQGIETTKLIYDILKSCENKQEIIFLAKDENGVLLDSNNFIYAYKNKQIIGYKNNQNTYIIHKKEYEIDHETGMFISKKLETQRKRMIYNFDGEEIGYSKIELFKNKNKFYKNNLHIFFDNINNLIYYKNDTIIGKITYNINSDLLTDINKVPDTLEYNYNCNIMNNGNYNLDINNSNLKDLIKLDVNCINVYFNLDMEINRLKLYKLLSSLNYICKYHPESYSGVKLIYKIPLQNDFCDGFCKCNNKCTCSNITFLIFQSGNIICTGFKDETHIHKIIKHFISLCYENESLIKIYKNLNFDI